MHLQNYISDLLYRYECVTIPQFGAFITQNISAKINSEKNTFYPPKKVVAFNAQLLNNDGLLARYVSDIEGITFEAANLKIAKDVAFFKDELDNGKTLTFKNVGTLSLNANDKIEFNPSYQLNYLTDAFGLTEFTSACITREVLEHASKDTKTLQRIPEPQLAKAVKTIAQPKKESIFLRPIYKYAAAAILAISLTGLAGSSYVNSIESHNELAHQEASKQLESKIQEATFVINNPLPAITLTINKRVGKFHVIVGAHREKENALDEVKKLRQLGKDAWVESSEHGYYNVVYSSYERHYKAVEALEQVRLIYNEDAWLYVKDLD